MTNGRDGGCRRRFFRPGVGNHRIDRTRASARSGGALAYAAAFVALGAALVPQASLADEPLAVSTVRFADIRETTRLSAYAEAIGVSQSGVPAQLSAVAEEVDVEVGDRVGQGDVIARLDCSGPTDRLEEAEGRLKELEAERTLAGIRLQRTRRLRDQNAAPEQQLDEATAEKDAVSAAIRSQNSRLRSARRDVEHCRIRAPFEGVVTGRTANEGDWLAAGQEVVRLLDRDDVELSAEIPASVLAGAPEFLDPEFQTHDGRYTVSLRERTEELDPVTRTREVRFMFSGAPPLPGTTGRLRWRGAEPTIPAQLIVRREDELGVMVVRDGRAAFHPLPEATAGRPAPAPGLADDARIIVEGRQAARADQAVRRASDGDAE